MNKSDSQKIAGILQKRGYKPAKSEAAADLIVLNACSVRQSAMDRVYAKINKYFRNKKIILAGCLLEKDKIALKEKVNEIWHPNKYFECLPLFAKTGNAYVPIMTGCNNFCSYCAVPYTRGREKSRPAKEIINEVKSLIKKGYKEIVLLGQNVNSYKSEIRNQKPEKNPKSKNQKLITVNFAKLLKIIEGLAGDFRLSFLTSHPKDMSDELIETMVKCEKLVKELHLPVQSGDNQILKKMNRGYTVTQYKNLVKKICQRIPGIKISTDVIVGFPGETKKQFQNTVKLFKEMCFDKAYIAKYSPRAGTVAAKLKDDVPPQEKKRRWKILDKITYIKND